jgi:hypothetical protein
MIEFIVSKFGILLFAVSVASILIIFTADIKEIFIADEGMQISNVISKKLKEMSDAQSLCVSTYVSLPRYIDVVGSVNSPTTTSVYYFLDINIIESIGDSENKFVVFTLINKRNKNIMSVESFMTDSVVNFEDVTRVNLSDDEGSQKFSETHLRIDPTHTNVIYMVKINNAELGQEPTKKLIFIPCNYDKYTDDADPMQSCFDKLESIYSSDNAHCVPLHSPGWTTRVSNE